MDEVDLQWMNRDLREQVGSAIDMLMKLRARVDLLKMKLVHHVDQGEGLTKDELSEVYVEIEKLFPRRVRSTSDSLDAPL